MRTIILLFIVLCTQRLAAQEGVLHGAWLEQNLKWEKAPKDVDPYLRSAGARVIFFTEDGRVLVWSGTVYDRHKNNPTMSVGDGKSLYLGHWTSTKSQSTLETQLVYRTIRKVGEALPGPITHETVVINANEIRVDGHRYSRATDLDKRSAGELEEAAAWFKHPDGPI